MDCYKPYIGYWNKCDTKIIKIKEIIKSGINGPNTKKGTISAHKKLKIFILNNFKLNIKL